MSEDFTRNWARTRQIPKIKKSSSQDVVQVNEIGIQLAMKIQAACATLRKKEKKEKEEKEKIPE